MANRRLRLIAGLLILASLGLVIAIQPSRPPGPPALPQPNGYDDFIEAGALLTGGTEDYLTMDAAQLRALTQRNAAALARMRVGLTRECRVPMDTSATRGHAVAELPTQKRLVRAVLAEGRLAELERHPSDAAARPSQPLPRVSLHIQVK